MQDNASNKRRPHGPQRPGLAAALFCAALVLGGMQAAGTTAAAAGLPRVAQASEGISLAEAASMVRDRTGGQVLRAETKRDKGRTVHRIRVLTEDGRVRTWHVDAETGRIY